MDRSTGLGSTDVVEVCGMAPWADAGPWRVYVAKTGQVTEPEVETPEMAWGHEVEPFLADWYGRRVGREVMHYRRGAKRLQRLRHDFPLWASPDATDMVTWLEIKNVGSFMAHLWDRSDDDGIPHHVRGQVTIGMYCAEVTEWTVVAAIGGLPPRVYNVQYDPELAEILVETARKFWVDHVVARVPPIIDASDACRKYLQRKWPKDVREMRESTIEEDEIGFARLAATASGKLAAQTIQDCDSKLLDACGDAKGIKGDGWKLTWKLDKNGVRRSRFTPGKEEE
jgi:predicted phage-related endonuclease